MRYMANELEHLLSGLCNEGRQKKLRKSWLPIYYPPMKQKGHGMTGCT